MQFFNQTAGKGVTVNDFNRVRNDGIAASQDKPVCGGLNNGIAVVPAVIVRVGFINGY